MKRDSYFYRSNFDIFHPARPDYRQASSGLNGRAFGCYPDFVGM